MEALKALERLRKRLRWDTWGERLRQWSRSPSAKAFAVMLPIVLLGAYWRFVMAPSEYAPDEIQGGDVRRYYVSTADSVLAGKGWVPGYDANFLPPPLQTVFVLAIKLIPGSDFHTARYVQAVVSTLTIVLAYVIGRHLCRSRIGGVAAAGFVAFDPHMVRWVSTLLTETNYFFLLFAFLAALLVGLERRSVAWAGIAGALLGLASLMKSFPFLLIGLVPLYVVVRYRSRWSVTFAVMLAATGALVIAPWLIRNYLRYDHFYLISTNSGTALAQANFAGLDATNARQRYWEFNHRRNRWRAPEVEKRFAGQVDRYGKPEWNEMDRAYQQHFFRYVKAQPGHFARNYVYKAYNQFRYPDDRVRWKAKYRHVLVFLGMLGFALFVYRRRKRPEWVMVVIALYYTGFGALFHITRSGRINLPLKVLFGFFAAFAVSELVRPFLSTRAGTSDSNTDASASAVGVSS